MKTDAPSICCLPYDIVLALQLGYTVRDLGHTRAVASYRPACQALQRMSDKRMTKKLKFRYQMQWYVLANIVLVAVELPRYFNGHRFASMFGWESFDSNTTGKIRTTTHVVQRQRQHNDVGMHSSPAPAFVVSIHSSKRFM